MFYYDRLLGNWRRILGERGRFYLVVDLTPIDLYSRYEWQHLTNEAILIIKKEFVYQNCVLELLPVRITNQMVKFLGKKTTNRLLAYDYLSEVSAVDVVKANLRSRFAVPFTVLKYAKELI